MKRLYIDVETEGLEAAWDEECRLLLTGIWLNFPGTTGMTYIALDINRTTGKVSERQYLQQLILSGEYKLVFHNASFDIAVLRTNGIEIPKGCYDDTMVMAYLLKPMGSQYNKLEVWGERFGKQKLNYRQTLVDEGILDKSAPKGAEFQVRVTKRVWELLKEYNKRDLEVTELLWEYCSEQLDKDQRLFTAYDTIERHYIEVVMALESNGLYVDVEKMEELRDELETLLEPQLETIKRIGGFVPAKLEWDGEQFEAVEKTYVKGKYRRHGVTYYEHCPIEPFNPNSNYQVAWLLMGQGWEPTEFTDTGLPALGADVLDGLEEYPVAEALKKYNELTKLLGTFLNPILNGVDEAGHIHGRFNQCETVTTRLSSSSPNLQNIPVRSSLGKRVRECFTAPPGYKLLIGDMSGIEVRILGAMLEHWERDARIADDIRSGIDTHERNRQSWGMEERGPTKNGFFALVYGAMLKRFALTIGKPLKEAKVYYKKILADYPTIFSKLMPRVWKWARKKRPFEVYDEYGKKSNAGFVYSLLGHRFHYPGIQSKNEYVRSSAERQSFNSCIQGTGAGLFKLLTLEALKSSPVELYPAAVVHDELLCYALEEDAEIGAAHLTKVFSEFKLLDVPIKAEFHVVENWSEK